MLNSPFQASRSKFTVLLGLLALFIFAPQAHADLIYSTIAENTGTLAGFNFGDAAINTGGTVAFSVIDGNGASGVYSGSGSGLTTIASSNSGFYFAGAGTPVSINAGGTVAFTGTLDTGSRGVFSGSGGAVTTIASDAGGAFFYLQAGQINNSGTVVLVGATSSGGLGIYTGSGGALTTVATNADPAIYDSFGGAPGINDGGTVIFDANGASEIYTSTGGVATKVADSSGNFDQLTAPVLNNNGVVAVAAVLDDGSTAVYKGPNLGTLVADGSGPIFNQLGPASLNDSGLVAFAASTKTGANGIYVQDGSGGFITVAQTGSAFLGSTITDLSFGTQGLNSSGQIAFHATLADGREGIYRSSIMATPEPSSWAMMVLGVGACLVWVRKKRV